MAGKKSTSTPSKSSRTLQIMFVIFSIILILSMVMAAFITPS